MSATIDTWHCGANAAGHISPNTFWLNGTGANTWNVTFNFFNASGVLTTVGSVTIGLADITNGGTVLQSVGPLLNVNSANFSLGGTIPNGHIIAIFCTINSGGTDHFTAQTTNNPITGNPHPVGKTRRSGGWTTVSGHTLRMRRSGAWVQVEKTNSTTNVWNQAGVLERRSGAWVSV